MEETNSNLCILWANWTLFRNYYSKCQLLDCLHCSKM